MKDEHEIKDVLANVVKKIENDCFFYCNSNTLLYIYIQLIKYSPIQKQL
jgi:hypothetical protein